MTSNTTWTAIRTDRGPACAHGGTRLATRPVAAFDASIVKRINGVTPMSAFTGVPSAYVAEQESHPPRDLVG